MLRSFIILSAERERAQGEFSASLEINLTDINDRMLGMQVLIPVSSHVASRVATICLLIERLCDLNIQFS